MRKRTLILAGVGAALFSTVAWAFPWDIDMVDSIAYRAYEWKMLSPPEGAVSTDMHASGAAGVPAAYASRYREGCDPTCRAPAQLAPEFDRNNPVGRATANPLNATDPQVLANGERLFEVYCQTCHGVQGGGGAPVTDNTAGKRFPAVPALSSAGGGATSLPFQPDGYIYLYVRHGGINMPSYSYAMSDADIWAVVSYVRTLPGAASSAPPPAPTPAPTPEGAPAPEGAAPTGTEPAPSGSGN